LEIVSHKTTLRAVELDFRKDRRWEEFVSSHPDALIYHHPEWLMALEGEYGQKYVTLGCEDQHGNLSAVLPLMYTEGLPLSFGRMSTGRRLSSLPRTPVVGPLALNPEAAGIVIARAIELANSERGLQLEIKSNVGELNASVDGLTCVPWRPTYVRELPPLMENASCEKCRDCASVLPCASCHSCGGLRFGNARRQHKVNWAVSKAIKLGLAVRDAESEEDLAKWYRLYLQTMRHKAVPPRPYQLFEGLWHYLRPTHKMRLLLAVHSKLGQERIVAGSILLQSGQTVFYAFTGCAPKDFDLHPHDLLQLEAIRGACRRGFRQYDFGEVTEENATLAQFKTKWGANPVPLYRYYSPAPNERNSSGNGSFIHSARRVWRLLPLKATKVLGDLIYGRM
jgi:hypothetical protein